MKQQRPVHDSTRSLIEEIIGVLWIIAGLLMWQVGPKWLAVLFLVKAVLDFAAVCFYSLRRRREEANAASKEIFEDLKKELGVDDETG